MPTAYYKSPDKNFTLLQGDCIELLNSFDFKFDMIFADPPYHLSNGGISIQSGVPVSVNKGKWDKSHGFEEDYKFDKTWLTACRVTQRPCGQYNSAGGICQISRMSPIKENFSDCSRVDRLR